MFVHLPTGWPLEYFTQESHWEGFIFTVMWGQEEIAKKHNQYNNN